MADHHRNAIAHAQYHIASHHDVAVETPPSQMTWADFHPGQKILPPGSPPAGPGEINWEDTLGGRFYRACEQLEALLYAVYGSRPKAFANGSKCQWYDRRHPRCLWGPEVWVQRIMNLMGSQGCGPEGQCWHYEVGEFAATGDVPSINAPGPSAKFDTTHRPTIPIRSRSGDPAMQYADPTRGHNRAYFPLGSVSRDDGAQTHDPEGVGWFGATQPGRTDSPAWLTAANGYIEKAGEQVTFRYTPPAGKTPTSVTLHYKPPGGWTSVAMTLNSSTYEATLGPYDHDSKVEWYIEYFELGGGENGENVQAYEPGGADPPTDPYSLVWFTHFFEYPTGFPEFYSVARHATDWPRMTPDEHVDPKLINLCRWILSFLGFNNCELHATKWGCLELGYHPGVIHHSPRVRPGAECCIDLPIRWFWSGSHRYPWYRRGGKQAPGDPETIGIRPLTQRDTDLGDQAKRMSWRGTWGALFEDNAHFGNMEWQGGFSWGTPPGEVPIYYKPEHPEGEEARNWWTWPAMGLLEGDVIDSVHVEEVIAAVNYLIDYGIWSTHHVCTQKKTPGTFLGVECGTFETESFSDCGSPAASCHWIWKVGCAKCCENESNPGPGQTPCSLFHFALGVGQTKISGNCDIEDTDGITCIPYTKPNYEDCWSTCPHSTCSLVAQKRGFCQYRGDPEIWVGAPCVDWFWELNVSCNGGDYILIDNLGGPGGGAHRNIRGCHILDFDDCDDNGICNCVLDTAAEGNECLRMQRGLSYYLCTPPQCATGGWDANHGSTFKKIRLDHVWHFPENHLFFVETGPPGGERSGNCYGDIRACGTVLDPIGGTGTNIWFGGVYSITWDGIADAWFSGCDGNPGCGTPCSKSLAWAIDLPPALPGLGLCADLDCTTTACEVWKDQTTVGQCYSTAFGTPCCEGHECTANAFVLGPVCDGSQVWVAIDLNLDGGGRPYRNYSGHAETDPPYEGPGIPRLRDYDLTIDPATWSHACPCETRENPGLCLA